MNKVVIVLYLQKKIEFIIEKANKLMMEKFELLKLLMERLEAFYANEESTKSMDSFVVWMNMQLEAHSKFENLVENKKFGNEDDLVSNSLMNVENGIGVLNGLMYRYSRIYSKVALEHSTHISIEEFTFLATLSSFEGCTKTALIQTMIFEKSTGIEIIKRLIAAKLASEEVNSLDKRSKILKITEEGKSKLYGAFAQMEIVSKEITSVLDMSEKRALHYILTKLEKHHRINIDANVERLKKQFAAL